jgi:hypothetical protein
MSGFFMEVPFALLQPFISLIRYIVYDEAQIKLRYIVRVKFHNKLL